MCLTIAFWNAYYITYNFDINNHHVFLFTLICYCAINFIPVTMLAFISEFLNIAWIKKWNIFNFIYGALISFLILRTPYIVNGLVYYSWGYISKAGKYHLYYLIYFFTLIFIFLGTLIHYVSNKNNKPDPNKLNQSKYILTAFLILLMGGLDYIADYGIDYMPKGHYFGTIFIMLIAFCIIKHKLMDIKIVFRKGLVYSFLITSITLIYLISVIIFERKFHEIFGYKDIVMSILTATIIALIFIPLKNRIQYILDKTFFKGSNIEIAEQNEQLRREIVQSERLKSIAILASGMAHEIKNPLTVLKTFSEFLPRKMDDKEFLKKFQPMIAHEIDRIDALVHELLDFAKPAPLQIKPTPIHPLLDQTLEILSNDFLKHKINIHKDYGLETQAILNLDPNQFKQALLNILLNAVEAMPTGGIITVTTRPSSNLQYALIKVQDTGCGIKNEDITHIFDPFFTKKDHGTGLGLSITYEIVRGHQGKIFVESEECRGTAFVIELPL